MPQYFGAPNGSSRSRRRMVVRSHPGDAGRAAEFGGLGDVGRCESACRLVLLSGGTLPVPADSLSAIACADGSREHRHAPAGLTVDSATSWYSLAVCKAMLVQSKSE